MPRIREQRLNGLRILVVEDEFLVSVALEDDLRDAGASVIGPYSDLAAALAGAEQQTFDLALLDINLGGTMVYPLADVLLARRVPFLFLSGYIGTDLPSRFLPQRRLSKPYDPARLIDEITRLKSQP
jgi:DNA-binding response OmpR family regulator